MYKENTSTRLKKILKDRNLRQIDLLNLVKPFCEEYNVKMNKSDISQYLSGLVKPGQEKLFILGKALNVSETWLMGLDVPMNRDFEDTVDEQLAYISGKILSNDNSLLKETVLRICNLDEKYLKMINNILDTINK